MRWLLGSLLVLSCVLVSVACDAKLHSPSDAREPSDAQVADDAALDAEGSYELVREDLQDLACSRATISSGLRLVEDSRCPVDLALSCPQTFPCMRSADCVSQAHGRCAASLQDVCSYADGRLSQRACDLGCQPRPGGPCQSVLLATVCQYDACVSDDECALGERCICGGHNKSCFEADCGSDADCGTGRCQTSWFCGDAVPSYHCTKPDDECVRDRDCIDRERSQCAFREGRFRCVESCPSDDLDR